MRVRAQEGRREHEEAQRELQQRQREHEERKNHDHEQLVHRQASLHALQVRFSLPLAVAHARARGQVPSKTRVWIARPSLPCAVPAFRRQALTNSPCLCLAEIAAACV